MLKYDAHSMQSIKKAHLVPATGSTGAHHRDAFRVPATTPKPLHVPTLQDTCKHQPLPPHIQVRHPYTTLAARVRHTRTHRMAHRQHRGASHSRSSSPRRLKVIACHRNTSARQSLAPHRRSHPRPRASIAPHPRACTSLAHTDRVNHLRLPTQSAFSTLALRPRPKRCHPRYSARSGSAVGPSTRQRARRDRLDAHLAPPPPSIAPSRAEQR